jgi:hypothetical protein
MAEEPVIAGVPEQTCVGAGCLVQPWAMLAKDTEYRPADAEEALA